MILENIKKYVLNILSVYNMENTSWKYRQNVQRKTLTQSQKEEIKKYYKENFGISVTTRDHELLYSICGEYKKEFMPFSVYLDLLNELSPYKYKKILDDKSLYDWMFPDICFPKRVVFCCNGVAYYYSKDNIRKEVCKTELLEKIKNLNNCIIKPSIDSSAGIGVRSITTTDGIVTETGRPVDELIESYKGNYVIERKIINNDNLKRLNPSSCNTLRIHTWRNRIKASIEFVSAFLRVGRKDSLVDNGFAGGIAIPVGNDGKLSNSGCTLKKYERIEKSDTGIIFKGYAIENFSRIVDTAIKAHGNLPHFDFVGWDFTIDENDNVIMIEFNADPDMRLDQLIFLDTCLLEKQHEILTAVYEKKKSK